MIDRSGLTSFQKTILINRIKKNSEVVRNRIGRRRYDKVKRIMKEYLNGQAKDTD